MTCREKLMQDNPKLVDPTYMGGCANCPSTYGYMKSPKGCLPVEKICRECWNREIPGTELKNEKAPQACEGCMHGEVCTYREEFLKIMKATQCSKGICANISLGGGDEETIDLNSTSYVSIDISCKHYHRKVEV